MGGAVPFGCGQCLPCRVNKRRQWMWRQYLESLCHEENCFITLTYSDENLPAGGNLDKDVVSREFIRPLRRALSPLRLRYFYVGEYGDETNRPHYHVSMFGMQGHSPYQVLSGTGGTINVSGRSLIEQTWGKGHVKVDEFNELTAQYVAGYVVKKLTNFGDPRLSGRVPEFARMSRRPGIGAKAMEIIADTLCKSGYGMALIEDTGDVPRELRIGRRRIPLSRYLLSKLREAVGFTPEQIASIKQRGAYESSLEMSALLKDALADNPLATAKGVYLDEMKGRIIQVENRSKLYKKRTTL